MGHEMSMVMVAVGFLEWLASGLIAAHERHDVLKFLVEDAEATSVMVEVGVKPGEQVTLGPVETVAGDVHATSDVRSIGLAGTGAVMAMLQQVK